MMVWGCMVVNEVRNLVFIDGKMNKYYYLKILRENLKQSAEKLNILNNFQYYQDNDPKHKAYIVREYLLCNCPKVFETPPQFPDLNPIENLWHLSDTTIRKHIISDKIQLQTILQQVWDEIRPELMQKLVRSMPRRLKAVLEQRGYATKY
jgi:hypothetical protein